MNLPEIGTVVAMIGEPDQEQDRQYGMLVGEFIDLFSFFQVIFSGALRDFALFDSLVEPETISVNEDSFPKLHGLC